MALEKIAYFTGRNDEEPNIALAVELCASKNRDRIQEIVDGLRHEKEQVAGDCIKVLYEIGERDPGLVAEYVLEFIRLLKSRNNRLVWGGMTALSKIAFLKAREIHENLETVKKAYETGSVITVDNAVSVFAEIAGANREYEKTVFPIIMKHLKECRPREVAQHCERASVCINAENAREFIAVLNERLGDLTESQRKRAARVMKKAGDRWEIPVPSIHEKRDDKS